MIKRIKELRPDVDIAFPEFREFIEKFESEINRGISTLSILSIINNNNTEGIYGYKILKELELKTNEMLIIEEGTLYPLLRNLERDKVIESKKQETGRKRKYYFMTDKGKKIYNYLTGYYSKLTKAISNLADFSVELKNRYIYCPMCANKIDTTKLNYNFCSVCGYNLDREIKERGKINDGK
ncbi:MAG: helix-turn-helix transcriptional regulator [Candidatus Lokiarchaeota archaeon]|nr:helix-turn-helix transcriptional regulator [Candidatus Lokiarchaeota archaeon]